MLCKKVLLAWAKVEAVFAAVAFWSQKLPLQQLEEKAEEEFESWDEQQLALIVQAKKQYF